MRFTTCPKMWPLGWRAVGMPSVSALTASRWLSPAHLGWRPAELAPVPAPTEKGYPHDPADYCCPHSQVPDLRPGRRPADGDLLRRNPVPPHRLQEEGQLTWLHCTALTQWR